jgi:hypothetical protein
VFDVDEAAIVGDRHVEDAQIDADREDEGLAAQRAASPDDPKQHDDDRHDEQEVHEPADGRGTDHTQQPEDEEDDRECLHDEGFREDARLGVRRVDTHGLDRVARSRRQPLYAAPPRDAVLMCTPSG